ncbi:MAG: Crp/Fnr family transcriptional regulator [Pseudomonadota bacterium]|nr:Crp/Fnr family transcriptional regulator [Pseudomonadota bacterium]
MNAAISLHERRRPLTAEECANVPWLHHLSADHAERAAYELRISEAAAGEVICRMGRPATYWFGVVDGLLKMSTETAQGHSITYSGLTAGGWFGEGTAMKREVYRYNVQALRTSLVAGLPVDTFHWLLDHSLGFNRFVMNQLNERLAHFITTIEADRTPSPEQRVARNLAALVNPVLFPGVGGVLRITQQELAYLVGLSRQRVNEALRELAARGLIRIEYGGLRILHLAALRQAEF